MANLAAISRTRRPRKDGGFTLIELVAVLVVIGVLAATAVPSLSSMGETRAALAARHLLHDLTFARQWSTATGTDAWVVFDPAAETWSVLAEDPDNPGRAGAAILNDPATGEAYTITLGAGAFRGVEIVSVTLDAGNEIGFDWLARPFNAAETALAAAGSIQLTGGHSVTVAVGTGNVVYVAP